MVGTDRRLNKTTSFLGIGREMIMTVDTDKIQRIYEIAQEFEQDFENEFLEVVETFHEYEATDVGDFPQYRVHVKIQEKDFSIYTNQYCYPVAEFGRERGLFLFDTVTDWEEKTITLRFGLE